MKGDQRIAGLTIRSQAERKNTKDIRYGQAAPEKGIPDQSQRLDHQMDVFIFFSLGFCHRITVSIGNHVAQPGLSRVRIDVLQGFHREIALGNDLIGTVAIQGEIPLINPLFISCNLSGNLPVVGNIWRHRFQCIGRHFNSPPF